MHRASAETRAWRRRTRTVLPGCLVQERRRGDCQTRSRPRKAAAVGRPAEGGGAAKAEWTPPFAPGKRNRRLDSPPRPENRRAGRCNNALRKIGTDKQKAVP